MKIPIALEAFPFAKSKFCRERAMRLLLTVLALAFVLLIPSPIDAAAISVGNTAIDRIFATAEYNRTYVDAETPLSEDGTITLVEIYMYTSAPTGCKFGLFRASANKLTCIATSGDIGSLTAGLNIVSVSMIGIAGDYIGVYIPAGISGRISRSNIGAANGLWDTSGDQMACSDKLFAKSSGMIVSLHGTGFTPAAPNRYIDITATGDELDISVSPDIYDFGTVSTGHTEAIPNTYFTLTNNGADNVDVGISATDMTGATKTWLLSNAGTPGNSTYALIANLQDNSYATLGFNLSEIAAIGFSGSDEAEETGFGPAHQTVTHTDSPFISNLTGLGTATMGFDWYAPTSNPGAETVTGNIVFLGTLH